MTNSVQKVWIVNVSVDDSTLPVVINSVWSTEDAAMARCREIDAQRGEDCTWCQPIIVDSGGSWI